MQPMMGAPPVPDGPPAVDAWRALDRRTRHELLHADRPHPDPSVAVVAVGYARTILARSLLRQRLPVFLFVAGGSLACGIVIAILSASGALRESPTVGVAVPFVMVPLLLLNRIRWRRRIIALYRMESVNAAALWSTERAGPAVDRPAAAAPPRADPSGRVVVRYRKSVLVRGFATLTAFAILIEVVVWAQGGPVALAVTALLALAAVMTIHTTMTRSRPHLPVIIMDQAGIELTAMGARLTWTDVTELRTHPFRAGGRRSRQHAVSFMLADPEAFRSQVSGWWQRRTKTPQSVFGTPLVFAGAGLDHSAEEIAATAAAFTGLPIRRFGR